jgi:arylsulfatase A-like enzyme
MSSFTRRTFLAASAAFAQTRRPNVVFILTDDQRWDCMSIAGHPFLKTPNLDRIAKEGAYFKNAFCTTALCSPSRASYLSGLYAHTHGVQNNFTEFPSKLANWPSMLKSAGYTTGYIGKWHMGEENDSPRPGFDHWASHRGQGKYFDNEFNINGKRHQVPGYYSQVVTEMATKWIGEQNDKPFALILGHKAPHGAWMPEKKYEHVFDNIPAKKPETAMPDEGKPSWVRERLDTWHGINGNLYGHKDFGVFYRNYHATVLSVDDSVGAIYNALKQSGQLDNTILIFASDNGFLLGEHGSIDKRVMWEESIRIAMLMRYPAAIPKPVQVDRMVLNQDVAPTVLDLCGIRPPAGMQGMSMKPLLTGNARGWRTSFLYEYNFENEFPYTPNVRGVRTDRWKYIHYPNGEGQPDTSKAELYDLQNDPSERKNLIDSPAHKQTLAMLKNELAALQRRTGALPDRMPVNPKLRMEDPDAKIR